MSGASGLRILMTADCVGGVWTYALELAEALGTRGVETLLFVTGGPPTDKQRREAQAIPHLKTAFRDLKLEWMPDSEDDVATANLELLRLEKAFRPHLVHVNGYANASAGFSAPVLSVAHSCVSTWWRACRKESLPEEWRRYEEDLRKGIAAADCLVFPTSAFRDAFVECHGRPAHATVIHNGTNPERLAPAGKRPVVLSAGRFWDEAKNIAAVCAAARSVPHRFAVAGTGTMSDLPPNMRFLGRLDRAELAAEMARSAVFLAPARYEPFGLAILEAACSGCALVLADIPTLRELWGGAARFVNPDDPREIGDAVSDLLDNPKKLRAASDSARGAAQRFSIDKSARAYLALYRQLLDVRAMSARRARVKAEIAA